MAKKSLMIDVPAHANGDGAEAKPKAGRIVVAKPIMLLPIQIQTLPITLVGDTGLIVNNWSEKAKQQMRDKQMKKATTAKAAKDPDADFRGSLYSHPGGGYGFPSIGVKSAAVDACSHVDGVTKVEARGAFHIYEERVEIKGKPVRREDMVKIAMGTADLRYRAEFPEWKTSFLVRFNANVLSAEQILNLFDTAGFAIGIGEWRPARDGRNGMFHVQRG